MLEFLEKDDKIYSHIRKKWLAKKPEEVVRQQFVVRLVNHYGYSLEQLLEEENLTGRGAAQARADIVVYRNISDIQQKNNPLIIVECKAESIIISEKDYLQGELYARIHNAPFFVTHNTLETKFWRVKKDKSPGYREEIEDIPHANANDKEIENLFAKLKTFKQGEFREILKACHNIIRNNEKLDPTLAFDEIAKILFMKVYAERHLKAEKNQNIFSLDWVETAEKYNPDYLQDMFDKTKREFGKSQIFKPTEKINLSLQSIKSIIHRLEKYNLSETSVDTKGIAFENFLSDTFLRGSLGQFFTPRPIVDFMIDVLEPQEGQIACDPACGSGGFLIRFFQKVQVQIYQSLNEAYLKNKTAIENNTSLSENEKDLQILALFEQLEKDSDITNPQSRLYHLAQHCIFGTDANERAARTAKMNMIMHGDGHGGIYHHDGFLNIGEITDEKFDFILTNPPFGMKTTDTNILKLYQLPKSESIISEVLFIERCINLLKEKGKLGIVLPESIFNNAKAEYVRQFVEDAGYLQAIISLPQETFVLSGTSIKCSLLFWQKFTNEEKITWENLLQEQKNIVFEEQEIERTGMATILSTKLNAKNYTDKEQFKTENEWLKMQKSEAQKRLKELDIQVQQEGRRRAKTIFNYPIFMYEADKVGVTTTGITHENELPNALQIYKGFKQNNNLDTSNKAFTQGFETLQRWDVKNFTTRKGYSTRLHNLADIASFSTSFKKEISKLEAIEKNYRIIAKINFSGELFLRDFNEIHDYKGNLFLVPPNSLIFSKINARHGCFYFHSAEKEPFLVSSEYPIIFFDEQKVLGKYVELVLRFGIAKQMLGAKVVGMAKPRVNLSEFIKIEIPVPDLTIQQEKIRIWENAQLLKQQAEQAIEQAKNDIANFILGV